jgi:ABC-2 type transport system permease protein
MRKSVLLGFIKKELTQAFRDPRARVLLVVAPLIQLTLFGLALNNEVRNVSLAMVAAPSDRLAWQLAERAWGSGYFIPARSGGVGAFELLRSGRADAVLVAPPGGLARARERGDGRLQLLLDASNAVRARSVENYLTAIAAQLSAEQGGGARVGVPMAPDTPQPGLAPAAAPAFSLETRVHFNPALRSALFMVPGVMVMVLCEMTIIVGAMALARERELGTLETLLVAPITRSELLAGKTLPFVIQACLEVPLIMTAALLLFRVPIRGPLWMLALGSLVFAVVTTSVGILISTLARTQQQAMMGGFLFLFPAIQMSGMMFPVENMPWLVRWVAYLDPLRYFVEILRNVMLKGGDAGVFWANLAVLSGLGVLVAGLALRRFRQTLN